MNLAEFHFIRPYWLIAFAPYLAILATMLRHRLARGNWSAVCDAALLPYLLQDKTVNKSRWSLAAGALASVLVITALAGPTWGRLPAPVFRNDSALVIALDLSRSMDAEDIKPSRLIRARYKIADILKQRKDGQTALLVYAGDAFTVTPLTDDTETISNQLEALTTNIMPSQGSNADIVLKKAVDLFKQAGLQKGQIILVTDEADADKTLAIAKELDSYSLSILAVGTVEGAPIPLAEGGFLKDGQGSIVVAKLNESSLKAIARAGNGVYQAIKADDSDIQTLLSAADQPGAQQGNENPDILLDQWSDKGPWLLLPVLPLVALMFRKGLLCLAIIAILPLPKNSHAFEWQNLWKTQNQQAQQAYKSNQFEQAAQLFDDPNWKASAQYKAGHYQEALETLKKHPSAQNHYNQGNALAQSGKLAEAAKAYQQALAENPDDEDARYNKELVEKELDKQKKQQQEQQKDGQSQAPEKNPEQKQDQQDGKPQHADERQQSGQENEQKPSGPEKSSASQEQEAEQQENKNAEADAAKKAGQQDKSAEQPARQQTKPVNSIGQQSEETKQANEQWLNRIPDDPAGLLKRKFKYQYSQRQQPSKNESDSW